MGTVRALEHLSVADYLDGELRSEVRHEYIDGQVYPVAGASNVHNFIAGALYARLRATLTQPSQAYLADMKVRVRDDFFYPDVAASAEATAGPSYFLSAPSLVVEVLSERTEIRDRFDKRIAYQRLPSLEEYVVLEQPRVAAEVYRRAGVSWEIETLAAGDRLRLRTAGLDMPLEDLYSDVLELNM